MIRTTCAALILLACLPAGGFAATTDTDKATDTGPAVPRHLKDEVSLTNGTLTVGGKPIGYSAEAGILVVYLKDPMDCDPPAAADDSDSLNCGSAESAEDKGKEDKSKASTGKPRVEPEAGMSYYAYFLGKESNPSRPITFIYNGGPGSSTIWLHMGAFGPKRVVTLEDSHMPGAPYRLVDNDASLLPESDLVFIDAPSTGFGHLRGTDKEKAFFGVDQDAHAFANFIEQFLSRHGRWNSPKYLFGESYGTTRSAALANVLQQEKDIDLNGVILLSQILSFDNSVDGPDMNPGVDQPYALALPTYAATAWYHKRLPNQPAELEPFIKEVEDFAMGEYWSALAQGSALAPERRAAIIDKLHAYTGLPADYIARADLRITGGVFEQHLLDDRTTGRIDTRFSGPTIDLLAKDASYDPQAEAISSAYVASFNNYVRRDLKFGSGKTFKPNNYRGIGDSWDFRHKPPDSSERLGISTNVMPDLAHVMKANPQLKVQLNSGYFDLATTYFAAEYEFKHLPVPPDIAKNVEFKRYKSGHMVYLHDQSRHELHDNVADFIRRTHN
jgi:carboxypeptidase C (cathepsin A)